MQNIPIQDVLKTAIDRSHPIGRHSAFTSLRVFIVVSSRSPQRVHPRRNAIGLGATVCAIVISSPTDTTSPEARQDDPVNRIVLYRHIVIRLSTLLGAVRKPRLGLEPNLQHTLRSCVYAASNTARDVLSDIPFGFSPHLRTSWRNNKRRSTATIQESRRCV